MSVYKVRECLLHLSKKELDIMRDIGVIELSTREWSRPINLVPKKDGTLRFCLDFRKVSGVSRLDFPCPETMTLLRELAVPA